MAPKSRRSKQIKTIAKKGNLKSAETRKNDKSSRSSIANKLQKAVECANIQVPRELPSPARISVLKLSRLIQKNQRKRRKKLTKNYIKFLKKANDVKKKKESFQQKRSKTIVKRAKTNRKAWNQLSREEKCRRMRKIERLAPGASVLAASEDFVMTAESSLAMSVKNVLTTRQVAGVRRATNNLVASNYAINKAKKKILNEYGNQINVETSSNCSIKTYTFDTTFTKFLESMSPEELASLQTVVFSADAGGDEITVTKAGWYPCDVKNPCSEKSFRILCSYEDKETYEYLKAVFGVALSSLTKWKQGAFFKNLFIRVKAILTGDLKFLNGYCGLQGCQATYFCPTCLIRKNQLIERIRDAPLRTLTQLREDYQRLQQLLTTATSARAIAAAHQECHSIKNEPMTDYFEVSHICAGVCHTLAGAFNAIAKWASTFNKEKINQLYADAGVKLQGHTKQLTGNHGRIVLNKLSNGTIFYDGEGSMLLFLLADIQQYAVAEILSDEKIAELLHCIEAFAYELSKPEYDDIAKSSQHIHTIIAHVGTFVLTHGSWGLFSDQPGEAVHKTQNKFYSRIPNRCNNGNSTKKSVNRNDNFVGNTILQNTFNDKQH